MKIITTKTLNIVRHPLCRFASFKQFNYKDALNFNSLLTEEELMVQNTFMQVMENAKKFADTHLMPRVIQDNRNESFDPHLLKLMG